VQESIQLHGWRECMAALKYIDKEAQRAVRDALREAAWPVAADTKSRLAEYRDVGPVGISVRARGVAVEQRKGKTTGKRPDFGALQMSHGFIPALNDNVEETYRGVEIAFDVLVASAGFH
jgi:hypothetical protein